MEKVIPHSKVIKIPGKILTKWIQRHSRGDETKIHKETKLSRPTISKALNYGEATLQTIFKISEFYSNKKPLLSSDFEFEIMKLLDNEA